MIQKIRLYDFGPKDYLEVWQFQKNCHNLVVEKKAPEALILVEHPHVYTCGISSKRESSAIGSTPLLRVERGGGVTYHGPGQVVGYPIVDLNKRGFKVVHFLRRLENVLIETLLALGIKAHTREGLTGVWTGEKKLASIGIAVKRWVTYHGFALNVNTDLSYFRAIRPCGLEPSVITSMERVLQRPVDIREVKKELIKAFQGEFGCIFEEEAKSLQESII